MIAATAAPRAPWYLFGMRLVLAALLVIGCRVDDRHGGGDPPDGSSDGGGTIGAFCEDDRGCAEGVCAHGTKQCTDPSRLRDIKVTWTLRGSVPTSQTCSGAPSLELVFYHTELDRFGFSPVPCTLGQFLLTHVPVFYTEVRLDRKGSGGGPRLPIPDGDEVMFDLDL